MKITIELLQNQVEKYDGKCLSTEYKNDSSLLEWECANGHRWLANANYIRQKHWCNKCKTNVRRKLIYNKINKLALSFGGNIINFDNLKKIVWSCKRNHIFIKSVAEVNRNGWCYECIKLEKLISLQNLAEEKGGKLISNEFCSTRSLYKWQCGLSHKWTALPDTIINGSWCPICSGKACNEIAIKLAEKRGGKCLSKYQKASKKLKWQCGLCNYEWFALITNVKKGHWCPNCFGKNKLSIEEMNLIAAKRDGLCLSKEYINAKTKLLWQCKKEHTWSAVPDAVKRGGWCPICIEHTAEGYCRSAFENILGNKFHKIRPSWLKSPKTNYNLELDGYCAELNMAFEYNGAQHYNVVPIFKSTTDSVKSQQERDEFKYLKCKELGINLFVIKEIKYATKQKIYKEVFRILSSIPIVPKVIKSP